MRSDHAWSTEGASQESYSVALIRRWSAKRRDGQLDKPALLGSGLPKRFSQSIKKSARLHGLVPACVRAASPVKLRVAWVAHHNYAVSRQIASAGNQRMRG